MRRWGVNFSGFVGEILGGVVIFLVLYGRRKFRVGTKDRYGRFPWLLYFSDSQAVKNNFQRKGAKRKTDVRSRKSDIRLLTSGFIPNGKPFKTAEKIFFDCAIHRAEAAVLMRNAAGRRKEFNRRE